MAYDCLIGNTGESGDGHELFAEAEMAEFAACAIGGLDARDDFQGSAWRALAADAVRTIDFKGAGAIFIPIDRDPDGDAIGRDMEYDWFDGNIAR